MQKYNIKKINFDYRELKNLSFGKVEGEYDNKLRDYLVITDSIEEFLKGDFNYVLSPKGSGKSALFNAIKNKIIPTEYYDYKNKIFVFVNQAFEYDSEYLSATKFNNDLETKNYAFAWAFYLIIKIFTEIKDKHSQLSGYDRLQDKFSSFYDLKTKFELYNIFERIDELNLSLHLDINGQQMKLSPKFTSKKARTKIDLNEIFVTINDFLKTNNLKLVILIDKIDSFVRNEVYKTQKNYVQGLLNAIEEMRSLSQFHPILLLRTDLFINLDIAIEYDKVRDRIINLKWKESELLLFILNRFITNDYIKKNYFPYLLELFTNESEGYEKTNIFGDIKKLLKFNPIKKNLKVDLKRNLDFRLSEKFLKLFLPQSIEHKDSNFEIEEIEFFEWLFSHFKDNNEYINPRCFVRFFNELAKKQFSIYEKDLSLTKSKRFLFYNKTILGNVSFNVFMAEVISETYSKLQNEELKTVYGLLTEEYEKELFKKINHLAFNSIEFKLTDIDLQKLKTSKEKLTNTIKFLITYGVLKEVDNKKYKSSILYRKIMTV